MIPFDEWFLPDGETHLQQWMAVTNQRREGRLTYQLHKYEAALRYTRARRLALDVGAHVGLWSYWMAKDFEHVNCFEPKPEHQTIWGANMMGLRDRATLYRYALGATWGVVNLETGPSSSGDTYVVPAPAPTHQEPWPVGGVLMRTVDSFQFRDVDFLKVDCEGYELFVLQGAEETIRRERPVVVVEQKPGHGAKYNIGDTDGAAYLRTLGYVERETLNGDVILTPGELGA